MRLTNGTPAEVAEFSPSHGKSWVPSAVTRSALAAVNRLSKLTGLSQINQLQRDEVECNLTFAGFLVFHCPLKADAVETLKMLSDSSHRVSSDSVGKSFPSYYGFSVS